MLLPIAPLFSTIFSLLPFCILPTFSMSSFWCHQSSVTSLFPLISLEECIPPGCGCGGSESNMAKIFQFLLLYGCDQLPLCPYLLQDWLICFVVHLERHQFVNTGGFHNYLNTNFLKIFVCIHLCQTVIRYILRDFLKTCLPDRGLKIVSKSFVGSQHFSNKDNNFMNILIILQVLHWFSSFLGSRTMPGNMFCQINRSHIITIQEYISEPLMIHLLYLSSIIVRNIY